MFLISQTAFRVNANYGIESVVYIVHAPQAIFCVNAKPVFYFRGHNFINALEECILTQ